MAPHPDGKGRSKKVKGRTKSHTAQKFFTTRFPYSPPPYLFLMSHFSRLRPHQPQEFLGVKNKLSETEKIMMG